jgi:hypothetical protein
VNLPFICSNIPAAPAYGVYISKPLYEVCLIRIKKQVCEKRSTGCTHRYAACLLKNTSIKENKYVVNQKLEHASENILVEAEWFFTK